MSSSPILTPAHIDIWDDRALIIGHLGSVASHRHGAAAFVAALDGSFLLRQGRGPWMQIQGAYIPPGVAHALECGTTLMVTFYVFPLTGLPEALAEGFVCDPRRLNTQLHLSQNLKDGLKAIHGGDKSRDQTIMWLDQHLLHSRKAILPAYDPRVLHAAQVLSASEGETLPLRVVAGNCGVSESRLMHLFKENTLITMRRFRLWQRMRLLTAHVAAGENLTTAGLAVGFSDSAHLSHSYRNMFGLEPSRLLTRRSRLRV